MHLHNTRAQATIDLTGGKLSSLVVDGLELLIIDGEKPTRWGSFPMAPWAGRLPYGKLRFDGNDYEFPLTSPPHANHGVAHLQDWQQVDDRTIATDLADPWPFGGRVTQTFELTDSSFTVTISITNDERSMPALTGWHPWFRRQLDRGEPAQLEVAPGRAYAVDADMIPTGALVAPPPPPWNETFIDLAAAPIIRWPGALDIEITSSFDHWVVFTEPEHALCIEPQSGPPNQINAAPFIVEPGAPLSGNMTFRWTT